VQVAGGDDLGDLREEMGDSGVVGVAEHDRAGLEVLPSQGQQNPGREKGGVAVAAVPHQHVGVADGGGELVGARVMVAVGRAPPGAGGDSVRLLNPFLVLFELGGDLRVGQPGEVPVVEGVIADLDLPSFDERPQGFRERGPDFAVAAVWVEGEVDAGGLGEGGVGLGAFGAEAVVDGDGDLSRYDGRRWPLPEDL
jgi:hypothetical protein